eukprot:6142172-Alexandrium_andersonii.AAC.1
MPPPSSGAFVDPGRTIIAVVGCSKGCRADRSWRTLKCWRRLKLQLRRPEQSSTHNAQSSGG